MNDIVMEWYVPRYPDKKQLLIKALSLSAAVVFFIDAVFFAAAMLLPAIILGVFYVIWSRSLKYEFEYVYVNGDFTISKIIRKSKRKDVFHTDRVNIEEFVKGRKTGGGTFSGAGAGSAARLKDFTSGAREERVYSMRVGGSWIYIEPSEEFLSEMGKYYNIRAGV